MRYPADRRHHFFVRNINWFLQVQECHHACSTFLDLWPSIILKEQLHEPFPYHLGCYFWQHSAFPKGTFAVPLLPLSADKSVNRKIGMEQILLEQILLERHVFPAENSIAYDPNWSSQFWGCWPHASKKMLMKICSFVILPPPTPPSRLPPPRPLAPSPPRCTGYRFVQVCSWSFADNPQSTFTTW